MNRPRIKFVSIVILLVFIGITGAFLIERLRTEFVGEPSAVTMQLKWTLGGGFAGEIVAQRKGAFANYGLRVTLKEGGTGIDPIQVVAAGESEFGIVGGDRLILARAQGIPVKAVALQSPRSFVVFTSLKESGIMKPKDFEGRTVGLHQDDTFTVYQALMKEAGVERSKIEEVSIGWDISPLLEGIVDVYPSYAVNQPVLLRQRNIDFNVIEPWEHGVQIVGNVYIAAERTIEENPELVQAFVSSLVEGWEYAMTHPDEAIDMVLEETPHLEREQELGILKAISDHLGSAVDRLPFAMTVEDFEQTHEALLEQALLSEPTDLTSAIEPQFIDAYYAQ